MAEQKNTTEAAEKRPIPSQAEGDDPVSSGVGERPLPSQAEGDEETIDKSLRQKEGKQ